MKKTIAIVLCLILAMTSFAGCGKNPEDEKPTEITVYSPANAEATQKGVDGFTAATGIKVNVVAAGTGELLKRVEAESANPICDVLWGGGAESMQAFSKYFQPYKSKHFDAISDKIKDANGLWTGCSPVPVVIMFNKNLLKELGVAEPTSWNDLLNPKLKGMISYANPGKSGSAFTLLCTMISSFENKEDGWKFIEKLYANLDGKVQGSSSNAYKLVADGEYAIGLTQEKSAQLILDDGATHVNYIYPKEGTSAVPDAIAIIKDCKNLEAAKMFVDYMLGEEAQKSQADNFNLRPARNDMSAPGNLCAFKDIPLVKYDFEWAGNNKVEILERWQEIVSK
ncbi:MAG: extracellular solute-binding protein [Clostridia bacterium]